MSWFTRFLWQTHSRSLVFHTSASSLSVGATKQLLVMDMEVSHRLHILWLCCFQPFFLQRLLNQGNIVSSGEGGQLIVYQREISSVGLAWYHEISLDLESMFRTPRIALSSLNTIIPPFLMGSFCQWIRMMPGIMMEGFACCLEYMTIWVHLLTKPCDRSSNLDTSP